MKTVIGMAKINWRHSKTAYWVTGTVFALAGPVEYIVSIAVRNPYNEVVAMGNYLYLFPLCMAIFVPAQNFQRLMNLGGTRLDFFKSSLLTYAPAAAVGSLASVILNLTIDKWMVSSGAIAGVLDLLTVFGFMERGPAAAFFQMTVFLLLTACTVHMLTLIQGRWYGWVTDALIIAVISVFTPIASLRAVLVWFFTMIIFHDAAAVQILSCLLCGAAVYGLSLIPVRSRHV
ncbi:MAG: hypothetical protein LBI94_00615 [Treponema sp.]|jgi:hypothetical protein|nr:hypothetical protein [Treponema sp.]